MNKRQRKKHNKSYSMMCLTFRFPEGNWQESHYPLINALEEMGLGAYSKLTRTLADPDVYALGVVAIAFPGVPAFDITPLTVAAVRKGLAGIELLDFGGYCHTVNPKSYKYQQVPKEDRELEAAILSNMQDLKNYHPVSGL